MENCVVFDFDSIRDKRTVHFVLFSFLSFFFFHLIVDASSGRGVASSETDAQSVSSVRKNSSSKTKSRLMKQLQMDLCMKQIVPRAHLQSLNDNKNDEQYRLRHRVSDPSIATKQHVNKRKSKGQVRVFGFCDLNPNLWIKSTPPFFHEERLKSPIHKLIEINKKAMLAFQEPPNEPAATTARCGGNSNNKTFNRDKSQNDAKVNGPSFSVETVTVVSDDDSNTGGIDYDDKIVSYKMSHDVNKNENITITSATTASTVAEEMEDDSSDVIIVEPMDCDEFSENHIDGDDVHHIRELNILNEPQEKEKAEPREAEASRKDEGADREQNEVEIQQKIMEIIDLVEQADSDDFEEPATNHIDSPNHLTTETDGEMVAASTETGGEMEAIQMESDGEMVATPTETDCGMVATPIENENENELLAPPSATNPLNEGNSELHGVGQLVWAQLAKFPFWPAIVYPDKEKNSVKGRTLHQIVYHI